jgi:Xaa-Pro dipeptidase
MNFRLKKLIVSMEQQNISQSIIVNKANLFYFTGYSIDFQGRMAALVVTADGICTFLCHELFAPIVLKKNPPFFTVFWNDKEGPLKKLINLLDLNKKVGLEESCPNFITMGLLKETNEMAFHSITPIINALRMIKDEKEIASIKKAASICEAVMYEWLQLSTHPISELKAVKMIKELFSLHEAYDLSHDPVVAFGTNSCFPENESSNNKSSLKDIMLIDIGCKMDGYCSKLTRTFCLGDPDEYQKEIYSIVYEAQQRAIEMIKPGMPIYLIHDAIKHYIQGAGYGSFYKHRTGHGIGIDLREHPFVTGENSMVIQPGMVFTIEPAIYLPGKFGIRLQNTVVVKKNGVELIYSPPKTFDYIPSL